LLDIEKIRQLVEMMVSNDLVEMTLRDGELEVKLRRPNTNPGADPSVSVRPVTPAAATAANPAPSPAAEEVEEDVDLVAIKSPMVGTFYSAPDPESSPFVQVGVQVAPGTVVCILEAMKVFSEIKAEIAGMIERILVKNGEAVEYGQPLFLVRAT
jgi:acetyl-CoA carboxylase biotin carboxyl carrier protein